MHGKRLRHFLNCRSEQKFKLMDQGDLSAFLFTSIWSRAKKVVKSLLIHLIREYGENERKSAFQLDFNFPLVLHPQTTCQD